MRIEFRISTFGIVDTAHHTLVIPKEENRQPCYAVDRDKQTPLLELVGDIPVIDLMTALSKRTHAC